MSSQDLIDRRDAVAEALEADGHDVIDTFGELEPNRPPRLVVRLDELEIAGETCPDAELSVSVRKQGLEADVVEVTDEEDLPEETRETLDEVAAETHEGPELTLWIYDPDSAHDDEVEAVLEVLEDVVERG